MFLFCNHANWLIQYHLAILCSFETRRIRKMIFYHPQCHIIADVFKTWEEGLRADLTETPCWHWDVHRDLLTQVLSSAAAPSFRDLAIVLAPHSWPPSSCQFSGLSDHQQAVLNTVRTLPEPVCLERELVKIQWHVSLPEPSSMRAIAKIGQTASKTIVQEYIMCL